MKSKKTPNILRNKKNEEGQLLVELIVAMGVFVVTGSALFLLIFNSYTAGSLSLEIMQADLLSQEGMESLRAIRDNSWQGLIAGQYSLDDSLGYWRLVAGPEIIDGRFTRTITVEEIGFDRRKINSKITWNSQSGKPQEINLATYLTNWQKTSEIRRPTTHRDFPPQKTLNPTFAYDSPDGTTFATTPYNTSRNPSIIFYNWQAPTRTYNSLVLKYRYNADEATNDKYAVVYSLTGCSGTFINLIPPTSAGASDTTVSVNLSPAQNLSQLCIGIYTQKVGSPDNKNLFTRDIWTEGSY